MTTSGLTGPAEQMALRRLSRAVIERRTQRGLRNRSDLTRRARLSYRIVSDLENGCRRLSRTSYAQIEHVLEWEIGSCEAILQGGHPRPAHPFVDLEMVPDVLLIAELNRRLELGRDRTARIT